ncbi:MAG TPA: VTT domain-containing protein [Acidimicrobiales bacterium]|nr:VTT domain-containing protein [Acidimicrobiales bacterium]
MTAVGAREALVVGVGVAVVAVAGLALAEAFDVTLLVDPGGVMAPSGLAAWLGVGLLVGDIVLPVPSSVVMLAHGALFGVVPGAALSLLGRTGNAVVGVLLGRGAGGLLSRRARRRAASDHGRGAELVRRWGLAAVVLTRPVPVLAESTLVAGAAMGLAPPAVIAAAVVGALPEAMLYAVAGDVAASYANGAIVFVAVIALAAGAWAAGARLEAKSARRASSPDPAPQSEVST